MINVATSHISDIEIAIHETKLFDQWAQYDEGDDNSIAITRWKEGETQRFFKNILTSRYLDIYLIRIWFSGDWDFNLIIWLGVKGDDSLNNGDRPQKWESVIAFISTTLNTHWLLGLIPDSDSKKFETWTKIWAYFDLYK